MNIVEILKDCPKGTKLWSPACGDCTLLEIQLSSAYPIVVESPVGALSFTNKGRYLSDEAGECLLFPSKENRDWSTFSPFNKYKPGDLLYVRTEYDWFIIYRGMEGNHVSSFISYDPQEERFYNLPNTRKDNLLCPQSDVQYSRLATEQEKAKFFKALAKAGYTWDAKNLEAVKKAHEFKPFDKVLVRDTSSQKWRCAIFSHTGEDPCPYITVDACWKQCIPYEGNEHLVGTTNDPDCSL